LWIHSTHPHPQYNFCGVALSQYSFCGVALSQYSFCGVPLSQYRFCGDKFLLIPQGHGHYAAVSLISCIGFGTLNLLLSFILWAVSNATLSRQLAIDTETDFVTVTTAASVTVNEVGADPQ
jgi:hypothetical protein